MDVFTGAFSLFGTIVSNCSAYQAIAACQCKLYHEYQKSHAGPAPDEVWTGIAAEQQCMKHQLSVMEHIGAPKPEIDYTKQQADGHYIKENENWQDYEKRNW